VTFVGQVAAAEMPAWYAAADIFVNSSVVDNQPVSILEAFAAGLPVVSTGTGDIANLVSDGETGLLVPAEDPAAMAKAVVALLEDPERARAMARRALRRLEPFQWSLVRHLWARTYVESAG
jgi:phenylacetate-CoA ligase